MWFGCTVVSDSLWPYELHLARLLCPWNFPGKNPGAGCHFLLQWIFPTRGSNPRLLNLLYWQGDSLPLALPEKPRLKDALVNLPDSLITLLLNNGFHLNLIFAILYCNMIILKQEDTTLRLRGWIQTGVFRKPNQIVWNARYLMVSVVFSPHFLVK